jgi:hypothetical protein
MFKKSKIIKGLILFLIVGVLVSVGLGMSWKKEKSVKNEKIEPVEIYFYLSEKPLLNKEVELVTTVIPNKDLGPGSVKLTFPEAITLIEPVNLTWEGNIKKDEFIQIPAKTKLTKAGKWEIVAQVKDKDKKVLKKGILTIEVTELDVILDSEEAEYVLNPLPKDKFVFVEIIEENSTTRKYSFPHIELTAVLEYDLERRLLNIPEDFGTPPEENTVIVIFHNIDWTSIHSYKLQSSLESQYYHKIDLLPYSIDLPKPIYFLGINREHWFNHGLTFLRISQNGSIEAKYKSDTITLEVEKPVMIKENKSIESDKFKAKIKIINHGILDKEENIVAD